MPASKAQQKAVNKYMKENYDRFLLTLRPKGRLDAIKAHAASCGESTSAFINRAIDHQISQDCDGGPSAAQQGPSGGVGISLHSKALQAAQEAAQMAGETVSQFVDKAVTSQAQRYKAVIALGISPSTGEKLKGEA